MRRRKIKFLGLTRLAAILAAAATIASARAQSVNPSNTPAGSIGTTDQGQAAASTGGQGGGTLQQIVVTGTLIPTAQSETALPVTTYSQETLKNFGGTNVIEGLRTLPSFFGGNAGSEDQFNGSNTGLGTVNIGASTVNLRGLGDRYTLTVVNGIRVDALRDLNLIPQNFIDRVDVLRDGATTTYGSDAVAGVVNLILRKNLPKGDFSEFDISYRNTTNNDQSELNVTALGGFSNDKVSVVAGYDYYHRNAIFDRDRDLTSSFDTRRFGGRDGRSTNLPGRDDVLVDAADGTVTAVIPQTPSTVITPGSGLTQYRPASDGPNDRYDIFRVDPAIPAYNRNSAYVAFDDKIFDKYLEFTGTFLYTKSKFYDEQAPTPLTAGNFSLADIQSSPYYPTPVAGVPIGTAVPGQITDVRYRSVELGNRIDYADNTVWFFQAGFKGEIPSFAEKYYSPINWEVNYESEEADLRQYHDHDFTVEGLAPSLRDGTFNPFLGINAPKTGTLIGTDGLPHTYNNGLAFQRAQYNEIERFPNTLRIINAVARSTFFPDFVQGGVTLAAGAEYRWETTGSYSGKYSLHGDVPGFNAVSYNWQARSEVYAVYGEGLLPVVTPDMKIPGIYSFDATGAIRYERYTQSGPNPVGLGSSFVVDNFRQTDPKVTLRYQPIQDLTFRASYSEAFRAPSLADEFAAPNQNFLTLFNPRDGLFEQPTNGVLQGGTVGLKPETARIYTGGIIYSPHWVPGSLTLSVDYYGIYQKNLVLAGDPAFVVNQFFAGNPAVANFVTCNPNGTFNTVNTISLNVASRDVEGLDLGLIYQTPQFNWGQLTLTTDWNYTLKYQVITAQGQEPTKFLGNFVDPGTGGLAPGSIPYWKGFVDLNYGVSGFNAGIKFNYVGEYDDDPTVIQVNPPTRKVESYYTFDLRASYEFKKPEEITPDNGKTGYSKDGKGKEVAAPVPTEVAKPSWWAKLLGGTRIQVGVDNLFDRDPPFAAGPANNNYDPTLYTIRNRTYYVSLTKRF